MGTPVGTDDYILTELARIRMTLWFVLVDKLAGCQRHRRPSRRCSSRSCSVRAAQAGTARAGAARAVAARVVGA